MNINSKPYFYNLIKTTCFFAVGVSLVLNSFTLIRGGAAGGPFEVMLLFFVTLLGFFKLIENYKFNFLPLVALIYLLLIMAPLTLLNLYFELMGSSLRTLIALLFGASLGFIIANTNIHEQEKIAKGGGMVIIFAFIAALFLEVDLSNLQRLIFLTENPNQIAMYSLCMIFLISWSVKNKTLSVILNLFSIGYGLFALSDTFLLSLAIILMFILLSILIKGKILSGLIIFWGLLLVLSYALIFPENSLIDYFLGIWRTADEGGGRITLALNGFLAFLESPVFGHGAGAFSGVDIPMMRFEAHNTIIDFLTMGGIPFVIIVYLPFLLAAKELLYNSKYLILGILVAIVVFSLFHFIGRHPIFWFVWGCSISIVMHYKNISKEKLCAE